MNKIGQWPHKWFGIWREMGSVYSSCPSIYDWINPEEVKAYGNDLPDILNYLRSATVVVTTSAMAFPNIITGEWKFGSVSYRTDGDWVWFDNLADYVEQYKIALPKAFYVHMKEQSFIPPNVSNLNPKDLDWPESIRPINR